MTKKINRPLENSLEPHAKQIKDKDGVKKILETSKKCSLLSDLDNRSADEILGYNKNGI